MIMESKNYFVNVKDSSSQYMLKTVQTLVEELKKEVLHIAVNYKIRGSEC